MTSKVWNKDEEMLGMALYKTPVMTHTTALQWLQRREEPALPSSSVMRCFPWMEFRHWLPGRLLFPRWNCTFHGMGWSWSWTWRRFRSLTALSSYKETTKGRLKYCLLRSHQFLKATTQQDRNNVRKPAWLESAESSRSQSRNIKHKINLQEK